MRKIKSALEETYFAVVNFLLVVFFAVKENWTIVAWSAVASLVTVYIGGLLRLFGGYNPGSLVRILSMKLLDYSLTFDFILAFLLPAVVLGAVKKFELKDVGSFEEFEGMSPERSVDLDFSIPFSLSFILTMMGLIFDYFLGGGGIVAPILALILMFLYGFGGVDTISFVGVTVGFSSPFLFSSGIIHGWIYPWAIIIIAIVRFMVVPWYKKGFSGSETKKMPLLH